MRNIYPLKKLGLHIPCDQQGPYRQLVRVVFYADTYLLEEYELYDDLPCHVFVFEEVIMSTLLQSLYGNK